MRTIDDMVRMEVFHCVSSLVATLASGYGSIHGASDLRDLTEQAAELCAPIDDWEEAAIQAGLTSLDPYPAGTTWQDLCEQHDFDPYQREIFEHWIISDWLADQLEARGERVDRDFANLTIWGRTTTGQGIAQDAVMADIHAAMVTRQGA